MSSSASKKRKFQKDNLESASRDSVVTTSADTDSNFKSKTKISIGQEIWRWCKLKSDRNLKSHCEVAKLLLDIYEVHTKKRIFPDLSEDDSDSSSVEDGSDDAQPPTAIISKTPSEEASSSTGHNQIVQVKIETFDIHQEADPHIITELATARTSHIPLIVKTEYADPEQTFSEHGKIQVPGIPEACFPNKEEPPSEQDIKLQVPSNQTYALAPESFDSAIHIEHAVEEESENEAEVHDTQKMEVNAAMETAKNQSKSRSSRVKSSTKGQNDRRVRQQVSSSLDQGSSYSPNYICPVCGKGFTQNYHMQRHIKVIHEGNPECSYCSRRFETNEAKRIHMETVHTKKYLCDTCGSVFKTRAHLHDHELQRHSAVRPFACPFENCDASFSRKTQMECHLNVHLDIKPYSCEKCLGQFRSIERLRRHNCGSKKLHKCSDCENSYTSKASLRLHWKAKHKPEGQHKCGKCGASYAWKPGLYRHQKTYHKS